MIIVESSEGDNYSYLWVILYKNSFQFIRALKLLGIKFKNHYIV